MNTIGALPPAYAAALLSATSDALDAGVFYQDAFETFVLDRIGRADPAHDQFLGVFDEPSEFQQRSALRSVVQSQVVQAPRGSWAVISRDGRDPGVCIYLPVMSDGSNAPATGGSFDVYEEMPGYSAIHRRMAGYEVYLARKQIEAERSRAHNLALIVERGFRVGTTYRNLTIGRETYSTVTITACRCTSTSPTSNRTSASRKPLRSSPDYLRLRKKTGQTPCWSPSTRRICWPRTWPHPPAMPKRAGSGSPP